MATIVQIFGVEHRDDALAVAGMGAEHLGFRIEDPAFRAAGSPCLSAKEARSLFADLPPSVATIALFCTPDERLVLRTAEAARPRAVQLCWPVNAMGVERESRLRRELGGVGVIKEIAVGGPATRQAALDAAVLYREYADFLILDTHTDPRWIGASGQTHDWSISREIVRAAGLPCILAGGLGPDNVADALQIVGSQGVDSYSRTNGPHGRKDLAKVGAFIEAVRRYDGLSP